IRSEVMVRIRERRAMSSPITATATTMVTTTAAQLPAVMAAASPACGRKLAVSVWRAPGAFRSWAAAPYGLRALCHLSRAEESRSRCVAEMPTTQSGLLALIGEILLQRHQRGGKAPPRGNAEGR